MNGCCESKSWALSERDLNKFIMKDATMRCVLSRSVASKTDTAHPSDSMKMELVHSANIFRTKLCPWSR